MAIVRLEDGSLREIADLAIEVLERQSIPPGTLILLVELLSEKLRNVKVIPCIPILREDGPGSLGRQLIEIAH